MYLWLYWLTAVDNVYAAQYSFACYAVALSCVIELCAEAPVFTIQVFCFVKLKVILNTLHIFVRSVVFLWIVLGNRSVAIYAFAVAQLVSAVTILLSHYGFFGCYIKLFQDFKKHKKDKIDKKWMIRNLPFINESLFENMHDFPFTKLKEFLPGVLINEVSFALHSARFINKYFNRK